MVFARARLQTRRLRIRGARGVLFPLLSHVPRFVDDEAFMRFFGNHPFDSADEPLAFRHLQVLD